MTHTSSIQNLGAGFLRGLKPNAHDLQFWGYETGNLLAAIAGAGGLHTLWVGLHGEFDAGGWTAALTEHGDLVATVGVAAILVWLVLMH